MAPRGRFCTLVGATPTGEPRVKNSQETCRSKRASGKTDLPTPLDWNFTHTCRPESPPNVIFLSAHLPSQNVTSFKRLNVNPWLSMLPVLQRIEDIIQKLQVDRETGANDNCKQKFSPASALQHLPSKCSVRQHHQPCTRVRSNQ